MSEPIRVLIVDDHEIVRSGVKVVLGETTDIRVVGECSSGKKAVELAKQLRPDVVLMDLTLPDLDGIEATRAALAAVPTAHVLMLTMQTAEECLLHGMEAGASGYLAKTEAATELPDAVRTVARGDVYLRPAAARILAKRLVTEDPLEAERRRFSSLTERERGVLRMVAMGYSAPEIGAKLAISPKTVDTYKQRIENKLDIQHRSGFVQVAYRLGLLGQAEWSA